MSPKIQTPFGHALPPAPRHAITCHMPLWESILRFVDHDPTLEESFKWMYPRVFLQRDVKELVQKVVEYAAGSEGQSCMLFPALEAATACEAFVTSASRGENALSTSEVSIRIFDIDVRLYAVFAPVEKMGRLQPFWVNAGAGISTRLAEESLKHLEMLREVTVSTSPPKTIQRQAHVQIQERIAGLLNRAPAWPPRQVAVSPDDVYLFQTGMAVIYNVHQYLLGWRNSTSVLFGFAFSSTIKVFGDFGPGYKFLGLGGSEQLDELELHLSSQAEQGKQVQALWAELPTNPLLVTPDLGGLRKLADKYGFVLVVDDTIGSFCNVDVLEAADIVVTSLTKSFSGYADAMGGSAVLNPSSPMYPKLKSLFAEAYRNDLYNSDAETLERNSRDYLTRSAVLNNNAAKLVEYLQTKATNPSSSVTRVHYPTVNKSLPNYQACMRPATKDFTPGYGCLFSVELDTLDATIGFYENLNVHQGPHLGAHLTLAIPYCMDLYGNELDWAAKYDLRPTQVRIAVGLEDTEMLLEDFRNAVRAADALRVRNN